MSGSYYNRQLTSYLIKQKKFLSFIKNIQNTIETKNYKKEGYTFDSFVKKNWNITKAQIYRYLIAAKILDQLKEFEILPNYERLCRCIAKLAKTPEQVKLLWKTVLDKVSFSYDSLNSNYGSSSSLNESNNNSNVLYISVPVTNGNSSNSTNYYSVSNEQSYIQSIPVTSTNTIYYIVNNTYQQPMMMSPVSPIQSNIIY
ncbi:hypothetical protein LY90DRAFT_663555 [Neocallimastix californiae]|uniref:Uncharacterized protein n=1 Tax=Neocallimastix californiae TaxID=1754190 RepID=A0A1Y2FKN0_9FUNG|nr:hypothetical protein LY90DRAFT_663555 [Neocallimastix californiae]|eukprot:ORY84520.1 hypothetical protein LY90DRAFT_663555 [Neocallimastix californiae]